MRWAENVAAGLMALALLSCGPMDVDHRLMIATTQPIQHEFRIWHEIATSQPLGMHLVHEEQDSSIARFRWGAAFGGAAIIVACLAFWSRLPDWRRSRTKS